VDTKELTQLLAREAEIQKEIANLENRAPELQKQIEDFLGDIPLDEIPPEKQKIAADVQLKISLIPGTKRRLEARLEKCTQELAAAYELAKKAAWREVAAVREEFRGRVSKHLLPLFVECASNGSAESQVRAFLDNYEGAFTVFRPFLGIEMSVKSATSFSDYGVVWQVEKFLKALKTWGLERKALPKL